MCERLVCKYVYTMDMRSDFKGQKRTLDPLKLELQMVVSYHVGGGNRTQVLWESALNH